MARFLSCLTACSLGRKHKSLVVDDIPSGFKVVLEEYQAEKCVYVNAVWEDNVIQLCDVSGAVLKRLPLSQCEWSSCTLPNRAECVRLQYHDSEKIEVLLQSKTSADVQAVISELAQSKALCESTGRHVDRKKLRTSEMEASLRHDVMKLQGRLSDVEEERKYLMEENGRLRDEVVQRRSQRVCTPDQMEKCLVRIEELERRNARLDEDLRNETRRTASMTEHMKLLKRDLEQSCEEKSALVESLHNAHTQLHDLQSNVQDNKKHHSLESCVPFGYQYNGRV